MGHGMGKLLLGSVAALTTMDETTKNEAHAHDEEEIGQNRAKHGGLYDQDLAIPQSHNTDPLG